jgi:hypothetical protein
MEVSVAGSALSIARSWTDPSPTRRPATPMSQLALPTCHWRRMPVCRTYWSDARPSSMISQSPAVRWSMVAGDSSGAHAVPDAMRIIAAGMVAAPEARVESAGTCSCCARADDAGAPSPASAASPQMPSRRAPRTHRCIPNRYVVSG